MAKRLLRLPEVLAKTGDTTTAWYDKVRRKVAPGSVPIGPRAVAWVEAEIDQYIDGLISARDSRLEPRTGGPGRRGQHGRRIRRGPLQDEAANTPPIPEGRGATVGSGGPLNPIANRSSHNNQPKDHSAERVRPQGQNPLEHA